jgi:hypothetical protein
MSGVVDPLYVLARAVLLDALEALGPQREAVVLVGAQAIYLHTGAVDFAVPEYTTDADVVIDPQLLKARPELALALTTAGFVRGGRVGCWAITKMLGDQAVDVELDLMVPEAVGGPGRRAARLAGHQDQVARKARGLEAALVDKAVVAITSMVPDDDHRSFSIEVAGPAALLVSKLHKIEERLAEGRASRLDDKDALDVLRILQAVPTERLSRAFGALVQHEVAKTVTRETLVWLRTRFASVRGVGTQMAVRAAGPLASSDAIAESCAVLTMDFLRAVEGQ